MKKLLLISASLLILSVSLNAQEVETKPKQDKATNEKISPEQRAQQHVDALSKEISISADQKTKIYDLALGKAKRINEIRLEKRTAENKESRKLELEVIKKDYIKEVKTILTPEQLATLKAKQKELKAEGKPTSLEVD